MDSVQNFETEPLGQVPEPEQRKNKHKIQNQVPINFVLLSQQAQGGIPSTFGIVIDSPFYDA